MLLEFEGRFYFLAIKNVKSKMFSISSRDLPECWTLHNFLPSEEKLFFHSIEG